MVIDFHPLSLKLFLKFLLVLSIWNCQGPTLGGTGTIAPDHGQWSDLLQKHVSDDGKVDYQGFIKDSILLNNYLRLLSNHPPDRNAWSKEQQLAYWINAYNAFTVKLIVDHYPLESIRDLHPRPYIPTVRTVWHWKFFEIGGSPASLDQIEHEILREEFEEPRIHFAINCASISCPPLRNEAYMPEKLEKQLDDQAVTFLNHPKWNKTTARPVELSRIFKWFQGDFTRQGGLIHFINPYLSTKIPETGKITYMEYNWGLNGR